MTQSKFTLPTIAVAMSVALASCGGSADTGSGTPRTPHSNVDQFGNPILTLAPGDPIVVPTPDANGITVGQPSTDFSYSPKYLGLPIENNSILTQGDKYPAPADEGQVEYKAPTSAEQQQRTAVDAAFRQNTEQLSFQAMSQIDPYGSRDIDGLTYDKNSTRLVLQGYAPVFLGERIPVSSKNTSDYNFLQFQLPEISFSGGVNYYTGMGVKVASIDGEFDTKYNSYYNHAPIKVEINDLLQKKDTTYEPIAKGSAHSNRTSYLIAGKRVGGQAGIASQAQLYYVELPVNEQPLGKIYKQVYETAHPVAINNSYTIPDSQNLKSLNGKTLTEEEVKLNYSGDKYAEALVAIQEIVKHADTPLFVFSSGNYSPENFQSYLKEQPAELLKALKDPNYGFGLRNSSSLAQLLQHQDIQPNLIAVSGFLNNVDNLGAQNVYDFKWKLATPEQQKEFAGQVSKPTKQQTGQYQSVVSAIGAMQCGVIMYHCLTANYNYYEPFYQNGDKPNIGTSFAAPQVTATAALLKQQFPWMTAANLKDTILTTATDVGTPGVDQQFGWGVLNVANALRGPAMFAFGDFNANLANTNQNSYFVNSIAGTGGLVVSGGSKDFLYLMGANTYTGKTVVNSGNLVISSLDQTHIKGTKSRNIITNTPRASMDSPIYVNHDGHLVVINANTKNITNNGVTSLFGSTYINGDLVQKPNATLIASSDQKISVNGNIYLDGTLALGYTAKAGQAYVPQHGSSYYIVLQARNVHGQFKNKYLEDSSVLKQLEIVYSTNNQLVAVNVIPKQLSNVRVSLTSNDTVQDQQQAAIGAIALQGVLDAADQVVAQPATSSSATPSSLGTASTATAASASNSIVLTAGETTPASTGTASTIPAPQATADTPAPTPTTTTAPVAPAPAVVDLATHIQNADATELKQLMLTQAGSSYADLQLASTTTARQRATDFIGTASSMLLDPRLDQKVLAYHNYSLAQTDWSQPDTAIKGKQNLFGFTLGAYGQNQGINYGVAVMHHQGDWHQGINPVYQDDLAMADVEMNGIDLTLGKALARSYFSASLFGNVHKYQVRRSSLAHNDQQVKFYGQQVGTSFQYGNNFYQDHGLALTAGVGTTLSYNNQSSFAEQATGPQQAMASLLSLDAQARHHLDVYFNASLAAKYSFMSFGYQSSLDAELALEQAVTKQRFNLELQNGISTAHAFDQRFMAKLSAGYAVQVSDKLMVKLSAAFHKSNHDLVNKQANLEMSYAFDLK